MTIVDIVCSPINLRRDVRTALMGYLSAYLKPDMTLYDIGCGDKPFAPFLKDKVAQHIGVDIEDGFYDSRHIDLIGTAYDVPAPDGAAEAVISSQVIEHLDRPLEAIKEAHRLLRADGLLFLSFPFLYPVHAAPHDYLRYTQFYMDKILKAQGFEIVEQKNIGGFWYVTGMFAGLYLGNLNRGILKTLKIASALIWLVQGLALCLHGLEGAIFKAAGKNVDNFRQMWTVDIILVCQKKESA